jgi:hypothetical protein
LHAREAGIPRPCKRFTAEPAGRLSDAKGAFCLGMAEDAAPHREKPASDRPALPYVGRRMAYRDDVTALSARHDALAAEVAQKTRELDESRRLLEHARARARLPVLDQIRVASPCSANWNQMTGDDRTRHCGACDKDVYNLSGMTREEAEALILERNGELCVRYYQRADGTILLADCTVGMQRKRHQRRTAARAAAVVAGGLAAASAMALHARATERLGAIRVAPSVVMGAMKVPAPPPPPTAVPREEHDGPVEDHVEPGVALHATMGAIALPSAPLPQLLAKERARIEALRRQLRSDPPSDSNHPRFEPPHEPVRRDR